MDKKYKAYVFLPNRYRLAQRTLEIRHIKDEIIKVLANILWVSPRRGRRMYSVEIVQEWENAVRDYDRGQFMTLTLYVSSAPEVEYIPNPEWADILPAVHKRIGFWEKIKKLLRGITK